MMFDTYPEQYKLLNKATAERKKPIAWMVPSGHWLEGGSLFGLPIRSRPVVKPSWKLVIAIE